MTAELLSLIALWCGSPIPGHSYTSDATYIGPVISIQDVNQCRKDLISCVHKADQKYGVVNGITVNQVVAENQCFEKQTHPGQDQR